MMNGGDARECEEEREEKRMEQKRGTKGEREEKRIMLRANLNTRC